MLSWTTSVPSGFFVLPIQIISAKLKLLILACGLVVTAAGCSVIRIERSQDADMFQSYRGLYRIAQDHAVGISAFIADDGTPTMLFADYRTGVVRRLFQKSPSEFVMGPKFNVEAPVELTVQFLKGERNAATAVALMPAGALESTAVRILTREQEVSFHSVDATLSGTLILPESGALRPAIVLLHGSGPLTRYSFGPYPNFFASLGFAVLIFDKRGAGLSTGTRVDASTGRSMAEEYYPEALLKDALAALSFLKSHPDIDPKQIGFWGSSEGGMLSTQVAARSPDVAFAINSSGFMGPLWQTTLYQASAIPRLQGKTEADVQEAVAFTRLWLEVARTGEGWDNFVKKREEMRRKNESALFWSSDEFASVEEMQWYWDHVLSFNPIPALRKVKAPVLGLFGESDPYTEAMVASANLRHGLAEGGNDDVTLHIFPGAGHSLSLPSEGRMAPGVFETLRSWLLARFRTPSSKAPDVGPMRASD